MFGLSTDLHFHLYSEATDLRKGFEGLSGIVTNVLEDNPRSGDVFIFINKIRDKVKLLHWQGGGFTLYYKRLERGTFEVPKYPELTSSIPLKYAELVMILDGISIKNIQHRKR